eukprot:1147864-Pelagomonas_calceolata.AAC.4
MAEGSAEGAKAAASASQALSKCQRELMELQAEYNRVRCVGCLCTASDAVWGALFWLVGASSTTWAMLPGNRWQRAAACAALHSSGCDHDMRSNRCPQMGVICVCYFEAELRKKRC